MEKYTFTFTIADFDVNGEEHRLVCHPISIRTGEGLPNAVRRLVEFAAKLLRCKPDHLAAKRILLKSAWKDTGKRKKVSMRELLDAMLKAGFAAKGREEQRIEKTPTKPFRPDRRRR